MTLKVNYEVVLVDVVERVLVGDVCRHAVRRYGIEAARLVVVFKLMDNKLLHHDITGNREGERVNVLRQFKTAVVPAIANGRQTVEAVAPDIVDFIVSFGCVFQADGLVIHLLVIYMQTVQGQCVVLGLVCHLCMQGIGNLGSFNGGRTGNDAAVDDGGLHLRHGGKHVVEGGCLGVVQVGEQRRCGDAVDGQTCQRDLANAEQLQRVFRLGRHGSFVRGERDGHHGIGAGSGRRKGERAVAIIGDSDVVSAGILGSSTDSAASLADAERHIVAHSCRQLAVPVAVVASCNGLSRNGQRGDACKVVSHASHGEALVVEQETGLGGKVHAQGLLASGQFALNKYVDVLIV